MSEQSITARLGLADLAPDASPLAIASHGQAQAALPQASVWVGANAGSGKTKVLIDRVARLLLKGAEPTSILCVTYTKAAASEMQDRLFRRLGEWCVMPADRLRRELAALQHCEEATLDDEVVGGARELFAQALETPGGLRIETIHAFCGRVLRRFPLEAGVAPGFSELDDVDAGELWNRAFRALGRRIARGDDALLQAARLVAEAGGKGLETLRALDARRADIAAFIDRLGGLEPALEALRETLGAPDVSPEKLLERAMGPDLPRADLARAASAYRTGGKRDQDQAELIDLALSDAPLEDRFNALRRIFCKADGDLKSRSYVFSKNTLAANPFLADLFDVDVPQGSELLRLQAVAEAISAARIFERSAALLRLAHVLFADFAARKRARAGLDFDDLIERVKHLFSLSHAAEWVLWKLDGGVDHVLLDEAQDTSPAQWDILSSLTADLFSGATAVRDQIRTLFVVGDRKQSIYSFQGADPENFLAVGQTFELGAADAKLDWLQPALAMSFRSTPDVLRFVDETFDTSLFDGEDPFSIRPPPEADVPRHVSYREGQTGCVELLPLEPKSPQPDPIPWDAPRIAARESSPKVQLGRRIARFVRSEIEAGAAVWEKGERRACRPGDFLILVGKRVGGLFDSILQALKQEGLPVAGADRILLLESLAVQDLLNLVRFALCPDDDLILAEIIKGPFGAFAEKNGVAFLDDDDLFSLAYDRKTSLWRRLQDSADPRHAPLRAFLADALARRGQPAFEFLAHAMERGLHLPKPGWDLVLQRFGGPAREPVTALLDRAAAFDSDRAASLETFLAAIEAQGGELKRELSGPEDEVRVMTVHGAKGLEAPIVILPDTVSGPRADRDGVFFIDAEIDATMQGAPLWVASKKDDVALTAQLRAMAEARALREHRRLLYVALTRARDRLIIAGAHAGKAEGEGRHKKSWYAACHLAMERLAGIGDAVEIENDDELPPILRLGQRHVAARADIAAFAPPAAPDWLRTPAAPDARRRVLAPSAFSHAAVGGEPAPFAPFGPDRSARLRRGRLIHRLFEVLPDLPTENRRQTATDFLARQPDLTPAERAEMLDAAFSVLEHPDFAAVFAPGGLAEAPVIGPAGADILNGRIDRLVITDDAVLLVDFKTDRPAPPDAAGVSPAYIAQMDAYSRILAEAWPKHKVRRLLVWTDGPRLIEV